MNPRIVFMGSPDFALPSLEALESQYQIVGVVTQPDRPSGRGRILTPPPVKILADQLGLAVIQPQKLREDWAMDQLVKWQADLIIVAAFGQILRPEVLDLPAKGCINVHASLLPRWRGAAPIPAAILAGDDHTGVTIMCMDPGVDTGPILAQRATAIDAADTTLSLTKKLARLGADLLLESLPKYLSGEISPQPQDSSLATYAPMLKKEDSSLDFTQPAEMLVRRTRAFYPWPGASTCWRGQRLIIRKAHSAPADQEFPSGMGRVIDRLPAIQTGQGLLILDEVQPAGKKAMSGSAFLAGAKGWEGGILPG